MKKRALWVIGSVLLTLMILVIIFNILKTNHFFDAGKSLWGGSPAGNTTGRTDSGSAAFTTGPVDGNIGWGDREVTAAQQRLTVLSVDVSKRVGNFIKPDAYIDEITMDDDGTLTSPHSYLQVMVNIANLRDEETVVSLNLNNVQVFGGDEEFLDGSAMYGTDANADRYGSREYYHYTLPSGGDHDFLLVFIIRDSSLKKDNHFALRFNPQGQSGGSFFRGNADIPSNANVGFVRLNTFFKEGALQ